MFGSLGRAVASFNEGLVEAWIATAGRFRRRKHCALVRSGDGYALERHNGRRANEALRLEAGDNGRRFSPEKLAATLHDRDVDLVLSEDEVLVRTLDPLPGESRQYLDSIVQHQLERVAPWRADDVLHAYRIEPAERGNDRVLVTVIATARSMHAHVLEALHAARPREIRLLCRGEQFGDKAVAIPVDNGAAAAARQTRLRRRMAAFMSLLFASLLGGAGLMGWAWYQVDRDLAAVNSAISEQRKKLMAARPPPTTTDGDLRAMVERRWQTPFAVLAFDALAKALPDNTWLTDLRLAEGRVRMTGISRDVPSLVPLIEASPAFAEATFFAPTARLPGGQGDRFHLEARLLPVERPKP